MTSEQQAFVDSIRDFCRRETATREQRGEDPHNAEIYRRIADLGWLGVSIHEQYGGTGGGLVDMCLLLDETAYGMAPIAGIGTTMIVAGAYERFGSDEQKEEILGGIVGGATEAIAMSEPEAGSDVGALTCKIERSDGGYVINGQKTWISNAHHADHILLIGRSDRSGSKHEGLTMLNVPTSVPGQEIRGIDTMGGREVNDVFFTDCQVPADALVGAEGAGVDAAHGGPERRAADHRRPAPRAGAAGVRRRAGLRQGAQAVRPPDRLVPDHQAPARRPRDRGRVLPAARLRRRRARRRQPGRDVPQARRRWPSSRSPRPPSRSRSRACR